MDAADPISVRQETSPASQEVDEIVVIGQRPGSGGDIAKSAVSGAWGLADSFTQLYDRNPVLAGLATTAIGVALGGHQRQSLSASAARWPMKRSRRVQISQDRTLLRV
jgi:hypothetical protein